MNGRAMNISGTSEEMTDDAAQEQYGKRAVRASKDRNMIYAQPFKWYLRPINFARKANLLMSTGRNNLRTLLGRIVVGLIRIVTVRKKTSRSSNFDDHDENIEDESDYWD